MAVYIDDMYKNPIGQFGRMKMSHMAADTTKELLEMADKIGVRRKWIQHKGEGGEHFDVAMAQRQIAIKCGAIPLSMFVLCRAMVERKDPNVKLIIKTEEPVYPSKENGYNRGLRSPSDKLRP